MRKKTRMTTSIKAQLKTLQVYLKRYLIEGLSGNYDCRLTTNSFLNIYLTLRNHHTKFEIDRTIPKYPN